MKFREKKISQTILNIPITKGDSPEAAPTLSDVYA